MNEENFTRSFHQKYLRVEGKIDRKTAELRTKEFSKRLLAK